MASFYEFIKRKTQVRPSSDGDPYSMELWDMFIRLLRIAPGIDEKQLEYEFYIFDNINKTLDYIANEAKELKHLRSKRDNLKGVIKYVTKG